MLTTVRISAAGIGLLLVVANFSHAETIFFDDFSDGDASDGVPVTWAPVPGFPGIFDASTGDYFLAPSQRSILATVPEFILDNVSIRTRVRILEPSAPGGGVELLARGDRENATAYLAGLWEDGDVYVRRTDVAGSFDLTETDLRPLEEDIIMQFDVFGESLFVWAWPADEPMPSEPLAIATDSSFSQGEVGILYSSSERDPMLGNAIFRFVHVADTHIPKLPCDFNSDGLCDVADLDFMYPDVEQSDIEQWLSDAASQNGFASPYLLGDADLDGAVNVTDLNELGVNWQEAGKVWSTGDFTGEGLVDSSDLNALGINWQKSIPLAAAESVPEPSGILLLCVAGLLAGVARLKTSSDEQESTIKRYC